MKTIIALVFLCLAVYVFAEPCSNNHDCVQHHVTMCHGHTHIGCTVDSGHGFCECLDGHTGTTCSTRQECDTECPPNRNFHCVDGHCRCGFA